MKRFARLAAGAPRARLLVACTALVVAACVFPLSFSSASNLPPAGIAPAREFNAVKFPTQTNLKRRTRPESARRHPTQILDRTRPPLGAGALRPSHAYLARRV